MTNPNPFLRSPLDDLASELNRQTSATMASIPSDIPDTQPVPQIERDAPATIPSRRPPKSNAKLPTAPAELRDLFNATAEAYGVPVNVLMALAEQESGYQHDAVGVRTKAGRAMGMMQFLPATADSLGINPMDPNQAVPAAAMQLRERLDKGASMEDAVMEHFAGPDRKQWGDKTAQYGVEVMDRAGRIGKELMAAPSPASADAAQAPDTNHMGVGQNRADYEASLRAANPNASPELIAQGLAQFDAAKTARGQAKIDTVKQGFDALQTPEALFDARLNAKMAKRHDKGGVVPPLPGMAQAPLSDVGKGEYRTPEDVSLMDQAGRDLSRGGRNLQAMGYGIGSLGADLVGADDTADRFLSRYMEITDANLKNNPASIGSYKNVGSLGDAGKYAVEALLENAATIIPALATGGIGAFAARKGAEKVIGGMIAAQMEKGIAREVAEKSAASFIARRVAMGSAAGAIPTSVGMESGSIYGDNFRDTGQKRAGVALAYGVPAGMLDAIEPVMALRKVAGPIVNELAGSVIRRLGVEGGKQFLTEAGTEGLQTMLENLSTRQIDGKQKFTRAMLDDVVDAMLKGGMAGGAMGVASQGVQDARGAVDRAVNSPERQIANEINRQVDEVRFVGHDEAARVAMDPNNEAVDPRDTMRPRQTPAQTAPIPADAAPAPVADRPMGAAVEQAAAPAQRVVVTATDGSAATGALTGYKEGPNGQFVARIQSDDGQIVTITDQDGELSITPVEPEPAGPMSSAVEEVAGGAPHELVADQADQEVQAAAPPEPVKEGKKAKQAEATPEPAPEATPEVAPAPAQAQAAAPAAQPNKYAPYGFVDEQTGNAFMDRKGIDRTQFKLEQLGQGPYKIVPITAEGSANAVRGNGTDDVGGRSGTTAVPTGPADGGRLEGAGPVLQRGRDGNAGGPATERAVDPAGASASTVDAAPLTPTKRQPPKRVTKKETANEVSSAAKDRPHGASAMPGDDAVSADANGQPSADVALPGVDAAPVSTVVKRQPPKRNTQVDNSLEAARVKHAKQEDAVRMAEANIAKRKAEKAAKEADAMAGDKINRQWTEFASDSGTLGIDRAAMPQVAAEHRGALVNYLNARGVAHEQAEVPASSLKPTQREFSPAKVEKAKAFEGGDRSILVSSDNHVLDGHHQWMAKLEAGEPVKVIRLDAPIKQLIEDVKGFQSAEVAKGAAPKPLDHGELNIPGRLNNIDAQLDKYKAAQAVEAKKEASTASEKKAADKARAKQLFAEVGEDIVDRFGDRFGEKELRKELDQMVKWEPAKFIKMAEKHIAEQDAAREALAKVPEVAPSAPVKRQPAKSKAKPKSSVGEKTGGGMTIPGLVEHLVMGPTGGVIGRLIGSKAIMVHSTHVGMPDEVRAHSGVQAVTMPDGTIHLVAGNLTEKNALAVLLHEAFHAGAEKLIGGKQWTNLMARMDALYRHGKTTSGAMNQFYKAAQSRVETASAQGAVAEGMAAEEFAAYAIEEYSSAPLTIKKWVNDLVGAVKAWVLARFGKQMGDVTPAQLRGLAVMALKDFRKGGKGNADIRYSVAAAPADNMQEAEADTSLTPPEQGLLRKVQASVQYNMNRVAQVQQRIEKLTGAIDEKSNYELAEVNRPGRIATRIEDGNDHLFKPLLQELADSGHTPAQLEELLHAMHAQERNASVQRINSDERAGSGMTDAKAAETLARYEGEDFEKLHALADKVRAIARATMDLKNAYGLVTPERYADLTEHYEFYVPLKGDGEYGVKIKQAMGHGEREEHILPNIMRDYKQAVVVGEKNRARQVLLRMVLSNRDEDLWTVGMPPQGRRVVKEGARYVVYRDGMKLGEFASEVEANRQSELWAIQGNDHFMNYDVKKEVGERVANFDKALQDNELMVYIKGNAIRIQIYDEELAKQLRPLNQAQMNFVFKASASLNRWYSKAYTGYNPAFILRNVARDSITGGINMTGNYGATTAAKAYARYPAAWYAMLKWAATKKVPGGPAGDMLREYRNNGGKVGASWMGDLEAQTDTMQSMYDNARGIAKTAADGGAWRASKVAFHKSIGALAHAVEIANQAFENSLRLALYTELRHQGHSPAKAAQAAKSVTVDFDRRGTATSSLGAAYLFFNPAVQGTANAMNTLTKGEHKAQAWALMGGLASLGYLVAAMGHDTDKDRWLGEKWGVRSKNLIIGVGDHQVRIPMSQEFAPFYSFGVGMAEAARGENKFTTALRMASSFVDAYVPLHGVYDPDSDNHGADLMMAITPSILQMPAQIGFNRNSFGSQIVPESPQTKDRPDNLKMNRSTKNSPYDKAAQGIAAVGEKLGAGTYENDASKVSPETLKLLWANFTGGLGTFIADSIGAGGALASGTPLDSGEVPIVKDFYRNQNVKPLRSRYYDVTKEARKAIDELRQANKAGDGDAADAILNDKDKEAYLGMGKFIESNRKVVSALRDEAVDVNADTTLTAGQKKARLKELEDDEERLYRDAIKAFQQ